VVNKSKELKFLKITKKGNPVSGSSVPGPHPPLTQGKTGTAMGRKTWETPNHTAYPQKLPKDNWGLREENSPKTKKTSPAAAPWEKPQVFQGNGKKGKKQESRISHEKLNCLPSGNQKRRVDALFPLGYRGGKFFHRKKKNREK